ncbi:MAG: creatininase family protein [Ruminococcaceae bacterium]|nr:creatininase family protein [Oscillospiraceae bacterium]
MACIMKNMTVEDMNNLKTKTVIIPVGVVEQHGFHLPLCTDICNAEKPIELAGDRLEALIAPTVNYCFSGGTLRGTINVTPNIFGLYVTDICKEFVRLGFRNIVLFMGHAGIENINALRDSLQMFMRSLDRKDITVSLICPWDLSPSHWFKKDENGEADFHAGKTETSLMLYWAPELVRDKIVMDTPEISRNMRTDQDWYATSEKAVEHLFVLPNTHQREEIRVGVMGFPEQATREYGEVIANEIVEGLINYVTMLNEKNS